MSRRPSLQVTLLVPGLFGPLRSLAHDGEAAATLLSGLHAQTLETLLSRAERLPGDCAGGLEACLFDAFGVSSEGNAFPVAALTREADAADAGRDRHLRADPVHLEAGMSEATLQGCAWPPPGLGITPAETPVLLAAVNEALHDEGLEVEALAPGRWYLRLAQPTGASFTSLYDVAGASLREAMPGGSGGARWRRLLTATQTALFACPANAAREAAGLASVNSLWFFGEGLLPEPCAARFDTAWSDHELCAALAAHAGSAARPLPPDAAALLRDATPGRHVLLLEDSLDADRRGDFGAWWAATEALQRAWLEPLLHGLRAGVVDHLLLHAGDAGSFRLTRGALRRFWRRRRGLVEWATPA